MACKRSGVRIPIAPQVRRTIRKNEPRVQTEYSSKVQQQADRTPVRIRSAPAKLRSPDPVGHRTCNACSDLTRKNAGWLGPVARQRRRSTAQGRARICGDSCRPCNGQADDDGALPWPVADLWLAGGACQPTLARCSRSRSAARLALPVAAARTNFDVVALPVHLPVTGNLAHHSGDGVEVGDGEPEARVGVGGEPQSRDGPARAGGALCLPVPRSGPLVCGYHAAELTGSASLDLTGPESGPAAVRDMLQRWSRLVPGRPEDPSADRCGRSRGTGGRPGCEVIGCGDGHGLPALVETERRVGVGHQGGVGDDPQHPAVHADDEVVQPFRVAARDQQRDRREAHQQPDPAAREGIGLPRVPRSPVAM